MSKLRIDASPDARHAYARMENRADSRQPVALYDSATKTIYLREGWSGATAAELSELVHEMVHHLQYSAGLKYECAQERERLAYKAQQAWLGLFGRDIFEEFELDPFTLLVMTRCMH